jgi:hypothetical protein
MMARNIHASLIKKQPIISKDCPYRRSSQPKQTDPTQQTQGNTWANVVQHGKTITSPKDPDNMVHDNQHPQQPTNNLELLSTHDVLNDKDVPKNTDSGHEAQTNKTPRLMGSKERVHMAEEEAFHTDENIYYATPETETDIKEAFPKMISKKRQQSTHSDDSKRKDQIHPRETPNNQDMNQDNQDGREDTQSTEIKMSPNGLKKTKNSKRISPTPQIAEHAMTEIGSINKSPPPHSLPIDDPVNI